VCLYRGIRVWSLEAYKCKCKVFKVLFNLFVVWGHRGTQGRKRVPVERHTQVYQGPEQGQHSDANTHGHRGPKPDARLGR
jgi:hypothetical protein